MLKALRKINIKTAVFMAICFYALTILLHVLVMMGIIPYTWVNGGRSESIATQLPLSIISIIIAIIGGFFSLIAGGIIRSKYKRGITVICWLFVAFWSIGFIQQLLGTSFEKMVCSFLLLLGIVSNLRMAIEKR